MSQAKVDRYKEEKKNRAKIIKKEKRQWMATKVSMSVVAVALVAWMGVSIYSSLQPEESAADRPTYTVNTDAVDNYLNALDSVE